MASELKSEIRRLAKPTLAKAKGYAASLGLNPTGSYAASLALKTNANGVAWVSTDPGGGVIECAAVGLPAGLGDPMFGGVENRLSAALFGIPAVKGVEFGDGFAAARSRGSENNDPFSVEDGQIVTETNHAGGILGGITDGMPVVLRTAMKPTPSIARPQRTVSLSAGADAELVIHGRHDPCIVPRAVPVVEAVTALVLLDALLDRNADQI